MDTKYRAIFSSFRSMKGDSASCSNVYYHFGARDLDSFNLHCHLLVIFLSNLSETLLATLQVIPQDTLLGKSLEFIDIKYCEWH